MSTRDEELSRAASAALHAFDEPAQDAAATAASEFDETATELGLAAAPVQPPAALRADLMARIALTPQLPKRDAVPDAATAANPTVAVPAAPAAEPAQPTQPGPAERRATARWRRPAGVLVAVAAAAGFFFGGIAIGQLQDSTPSTGQTQAEQLADIAAAPDAQRAAAEVAGGGTATLVWSGELGRSALLADGLAPLPQGQTYQLWYIGAEGPVSAGTFEASSNGTTWHVLEGQMSAGDVVGVTVEPAGGSPEPTSAPIVQIAS